MLGNLKNGSENSMLGGRSVS